MTPRAFGSTGRWVTPFGLGGEGILRTHGEDAGARDVISAAVALGVSYFDSARAYAGSEGYYGAFWRANPDARAKVFITSKSASRDRDGARRDLEKTLATMHVASIDLWQLHDVRTERDLAAITAKGGALETFLAEKKAGRVKHIGVTGHHDPRVLLRAIELLPVESVLLPINVAEGVIGGFLTEVMPEARRRGMAVVGMKVLGQGTFFEAGLGLDAASLLRYAWAQGPDTLIVGCSTPAEVRANEALASDSVLMDADEQAALLERVRRSAKQLVYYRGRV